MALSDIEIAQSTKLRPITEIAEKAGIDPEHIELYGRYKAKLDSRLILKSERKNGKLVLVTAITPTPAGEGKTTTTIGLAAETVDDKAKLTVVHVDAALPGYLSRVDVEGVALINMVVEHGCQEIVCGADGVEVAGEVEVYVLHRDDLCVAASGSSSLYAENRPEGRLS